MMTVAWLNNRKFRLRSSLHLANREGMICRPGRERALQTKCKLKLKECRIKVNLNMGLFNRLNIFRCMSFQ